jgi:hypothetical protein
LRARPSITKRARENERAERKLDKAQRRERRKEERAKTGTREDDVDPDIAWITPGPQELDPELFGNSPKADD